MTRLEKGIHGFLISVVFSILNWVVINKFLIDLSLGKYLIIELLLLVSMKFYIFTIRKLGLK
jgi:hypothetical protein